MLLCCFFFFKQKTAYEMRISDWSSDVCSSDLAENVRLDMHQTRADLRGEINTGGGFLDKIRFRSGFADYQHSEIEDTGEVGTTFRSEEHTSELQSLMRISYAVFCLKKKTKTNREKIEQIQKRK